MSEAVWFESRCHGWLVQRGVVVLLGLGRRDVADGLQQPAILVPIDPFQGRDGVSRPNRDSLVEFEASFEGRQGQIEF